MFMLGVLYKKCMKSCVVLMRIWSPLYRMERYHHVPYDTTGNGGKIVKSVQWSWGQKCKNSVSTQAYGYLCNHWMEAGDLQQPQAGWPWRLIHRPAAPAENKRTFSASNTLQSEVSTENTGRHGGFFFLLIPAQLMWSRIIYQHWVLLVHNPGRQGNAETGCCRREEKWRVLPHLHTLHNMNCITLFFLLLFFCCYFYFYLEGSVMKRYFFLCMQPSHSWKCFRISSERRRCWFILNCF